MSGCRREPAIKYLLVYKFFSARSVPCQSEAGNTTESREGAKEIQGKKGNGTARSEGVALVQNVHRMCAP